VDNTVSLDTITELDNKIQSLTDQDHDQKTLSLLEADHEQDVGAEQVGDQDLAKVVHDLAPVHTVLVNLAASLQTKVDLAIRELQDIRIKLANEMNTTADLLTNVGEIKLPSSFPSSSITSSMMSSTSPACQTIVSIHQYRDSAVNVLRAQSEILTGNQMVTNTNREGVKVGEDFNLASDLLDSSFQQLRTWLDQLGTAARQLQHCDTDGASGGIRKFSIEKCRDIDALEREAVLEKMGELSIRNCSIQSRKPVRSLGHTLDLQEIMLLAKNAKSLVYEVSLQMLKLVDGVKGEEINATNTYHKLTKENSELLRRYCFYLKLKIQQL